MECDKNLYSSDLHAISPCYLDPESRKPPSTVNPVAGGSVLGGWLAELTKVGPAQ